MQRKTVYKIGMTRNEELEYLERVEYLRRKEVSLGWLRDFRQWKMKADLTFRSLAAPERAEKSVREWLRIVASGSWAIVAYERQDRGAVHAHLVLDREIDYVYSAKVWQHWAGFCRINKIKSTEAAIRYAIKHAIKRGEFDIFGPFGSNIYSTVRVGR